MSAGVISVAMLRILSLAAILLFSVHGALAKPVTLLVLGDSLTAGLGLELRDAFPAKLEERLRPAIPISQSLTPGFPVTQPPMGWPGWTGR